MERDSYAHGEPSWCDLGTDLAVAVPFYSELFGWTIPEGNPEAGGYTLAQLRGRNVCGFGPQGNPGPPYWTMYVNVDSADDAVAGITRDGGAVLLPPMDVPDAGRMAIVADPWGAAFGLWQPREHRGAQLYLEPNTLCWVELITDHVAESKQFYADTLGWTNQTSTGDGMDYTEWQVGGQPFGGMMKTPPMMPAGTPPHWGVYFAVSDCDATAARTLELGGQQHVGPTDIEPGRFAVLADPTGAVFNVIALKPELAG